MTSELQETAAGPSIKEMFEGIDRAVSRFEQSIPEDRRNSFHFMLLGFDNFPMLPPMKKKGIDQNGFFSIDLPLKDDGVFPLKFKPNAIKDFLGLDKSAEGTSEEHHIIYSAMAELATYEALASFATERASAGGDKNAALIAKGLTDSVAVLSAQVDANIDEVAPGSRDGLVKFRQDLAEQRFKAQFARAVPEIDQTRKI